MLNVRGRFNIATASVTAICHQNATSKFLGIDFVRKFGGERGIRTLEGLLTLTPLAGVRLRPLGHLSAHWECFCVSRLRRPLSDGPAARGAHDTEALRGRQRGFGLRARAALRPQAASRARTNSCTDSSAASSASGLLPPACAKSARPPPRPPTCAATAPASSPALMRAV